MSLLSSGEPLSSTPSSVAVADASAFGAHRDPSFIRTFKAQHCVEGWVEHVSTKKKYVPEASCSHRRALLTCWRVTG